MSTPVTATEPASARATWLFSAAVFVSAFLLFQVQPLISKAILPWFGGTPSVWTTCMLFFQVVLFAGYSYSHLVSARLPVRLQAATHVLLLAVAVALLNILPASNWKPSGDESPVLRIVLLLTATVGLPYFLLSTTGPLLQRWYSLVFPYRSPYRLYALSNAGSLLALLSYPFLFEPLATMSQQGRGWQLGFWLFAGLCIACIMRLLGSGAQSPGTPTESLAASPPPTLGRFALWFILALAASAMLLATTNQVCQDVAVVPFLWVAPLSLYLLSFVLCFDSDRWYRRDLWAPACTLLIVTVCWVQVWGQSAFLPVQVSIYFATLLAMCMVCHGELARMRPAPQHLTAFYLTLSAGGAGGGLFVALLAPHVFPDYWEFHICLAAGTIISIVAYYHSRGWIGPDERPPVGWTLIAILLVSVVGVVFTDKLNEQSQSVAVIRNFYGVLKADQEVRSRTDASGEVISAEMMTLRHGRILHGQQYVEPGSTHIATSYYCENSGVGRAAALLAERAGPLRMGVVGLGVGTMAAYGRTGDVVRFYEINAADVRIAQSQFTFLRDTPAEVQIALGDARLSMENEDPQHFDLLVLDAFSGDAIPTHLLTREAMRLMLEKHMQPDGIIAVHVSNLHFDLRPVVAALADEFQLASALVDDPGKQRAGDLDSRWILLAKDATVLKHRSLDVAVTTFPEKRVLWTDDFSNLFSVLR